MTREYGTTCNECGLFWGTTTGGKPPQERTVETFSLRYHLPQALDFPKNPADAVEVLLLKNGSPVEGDLHFCSVGCEQRFLKTQFARLVDIRTKLEDAVAEAEPMTSDQAKAIGIDVAEEPA